MAAPIHDTARPQVWFVTGSSSGLGKRLVHEVLSRGDQVVATARRLSDLEYVDSLHGGVSRVLKLVLDVTEASAILASKVAAAVEHFGHVDILVNNAGFLTSGVWEETSAEMTQQQFDVNLFGALNMTRSILPHFRRAKAGVVIFMGSIGGWLGTGAGGAYSASKFALEGAAESLAGETVDLQGHEMAHLGIRTHIFVMGQFRTGILDVHRKVDLLKPSEIREYDAIKNGMATRHEARRGRQLGDPELAAARIVDVARLENMSEEEAEALPMRIPLGSDALTVMRTKCEQTLKLLEQWSDFAASTDFPGEAKISDYR